MNPQNSTRRSLTASKSAEHGKRRDIENTTQLLVEGNDFRNFFEAFAKHHELSDSFQIWNFGGVNDLQEFLSGFVKAPNFSTVESIGIARDAEQDEGAALQSVRSSLDNAKLPMPTAAGAQGSDRPTVRVLILPGGGKPGMLETLLCRTFADQDVNRCIDAFFTCVNALPDMSIRRPDKARAHAYVTTTQRPEHSVGVAAKAGVWDLDHAAFDGVRAFLKSLAAPQP